MTDWQGLYVLAYCDYVQKEMSGGAELVATELFGRSAGRLSVTLISGLGRSTEVGSGAWPFRVIHSRGLDLSRILGVQMLVAPGLLLASFRELRRRRPHVVHLSSIHFLGSLVGAVVAALFRLPVVVTVHLAGLEGLPWYVRIPTQAYEHTIGRLILARASTVVAVSEAVAKHVGSLGVGADRICVIRNGVDSNRFVPIARSVAGPEVAFVGRLIANKGVEELVAAFKEVDCPSARLRIVGSGPLWDTLQLAANEDPRIELLGYRADVADVLGRSDVYVRVSTTEGRSLAILEAMASGCAVVASDIEANRELIDNGRTGWLVAAGDHRSLVQCLSRVIDDRAAAGRLGASARQAVRTSSWTEASLRFTDVLAAAAGRQ